MVEGSAHNYTFMIQYIYNALPVFDRMMGTDASEPYAWDSRSQVDEREEL